MRILKVVQPLRFLRNFLGSSRGRRRVLMFGPASNSLPASIDTLLENPEFRTAFIAGSDVIERERGWSVWRETQSRTATEGVNTSERYFLTELNLQVSLFRALARCGLQYDAIAGISLGDMSADFASGALTFEETLKGACDLIPIILAASGGDLVTANATSDKVKEVVSSAEGPSLVFDWPLRSTWGVPAEIEKDTLDRLRAAGISYKRVGFNVLLHTSRVDTESVRTNFERLPDRPRSKPQYSTFEAGLVRDLPTSERWLRMLAEPARLSGMWKAMCAERLTDIVYVGSVAADREIFRNLPRAERPTGFERAESLIASHVATLAGSAKKAPRVPSDVVTAIRSPEFARDPYPHYREWSRRGSVQKLSMKDKWVVFGYDAAAAVLKQPALYSSSPFAHVSPTLLGADPPDHTRVRKMLTPFFSRERQVEQQESIGRSAKATIDRIRQMKTFDAAADVAAPLSFATACDWLGLDQHKAVPLSTIVPTEVKWSDVECALVPDGAIAGLAESGEVSREEIQLLMPFLIAARATTTRDLLLLSMYTLLERPDLREQMSSDSALIPAMLEELLRYEPPVHGLVRRTRDAVEIDGVKVPANTTLWVMIGAANRDPAKFDRADDFVIGREGPRHLSFGAGPHFCMGSHMGRMEVEVILQALIPELARIKAAAPPDFVFNDIRNDLPWMRETRAWKLSYAQ